MINPNATLVPALDSLPLFWQMGRPDKFALAALAKAAVGHGPPHVAVEVGSYKGGSLQVLAEHACKVYSLDIEPLADSLGRHFHNVEFVTGDSRETLPALLAAICDRGEILGLILIDGDHSAEVVRHDLNAVLSHFAAHPPADRLHVVCHDSFNPDCRRGILAANWAACPFLSFVEIDFVPGRFYEHGGEGGESAPPLSMYGGLAVAILTPERQPTPPIRQWQRGLYEAVLACSRYARRSPLYSARRRLMLIAKSLRKAIMKNGSR